MKISHILYSGLLVMALGSCSEQPKQAPVEPQKEEKPADQKIIGEDGKLYQSEQFADLRVKFHYYIPQWDSLSGEKQKELVYYLYEAGLVVAISCGIRIANTILQCDMHCKTSIQLIRVIRMLMVGKTSNCTSNRFGRTMGFTTITIAIS